MNQAGTPRGDDVEDIGHLVLVGMGVDAPARDTDLLTLAGAVGARVAYLQVGTPTLDAVLDQLAAADAGARVRLFAAPSAGAAAPARSWLRRVTSDWIRRNPDVLTIDVADRPVHGAEAGLSSPAWEQVPGHRRHVLICRGPRCTARGAAATAAAIDARLRDAGLGEDSVLVAHTGCLYPCNHAPVVVVHPDDQWWGPVSAGDAQTLVDSWADGPHEGRSRFVQRPAVLRGPPDAPPS